MRDILRIERLALDAIEQLDGPTLHDVLVYIGDRRRLWPWTIGSVVVALERLTDTGWIERVRTTPTPLGPTHWRYVLCKSGFTARETAP